MSNLKNLFRCMRPKQWVKNLFIFSPLLLSGKIMDRGDVFDTVFAFFLFCTLSSGVYIINDLQDIKKDQFHPQKKNRPITSGLVKPNVAWTFSIVLILTGLVLSLIFNKPLFFIFLGYLSINIIYSFFLKHEVLFDVVFIAFGFELRLWAGALVINLAPSIWLQLCVFVLAIFLGLIKRRHEKTLLYDQAIDHRSVLSHYKVYFLDQLIVISATLCVVFYGLYAISPDLVRRMGSSNMTYTMPFVIYGIFRYLYVVHVRKLGGDPGDVLLRDKLFLINIIAWLFATILIIYVC